MTTGVANILWAVDIIIFSRCSLSLENYFKASSTVKRLSKAALEIRRLTGSQITAGRGSWVTEGSKSKTGKLLLHTLVNYSTVTQAIEVSESLLKKYHSFVSSIQFPRGQSNVVLCPFLLGAHLPPRACQPHLCLHSSCRCWTQASWKPKTGTC